MARDPTKEPVFQKLVRTFLNTKPQPHKPKKKKFAKKTTKKPGR